MSISHEDPNTTQTASTVATNKLKPLKIWIIQEGMFNVM